MNQKGFANIILVIVVVLGLIGSGYYVFKNGKDKASPTNSVPSNNDEVTRQACAEQNIKIASLKTLNAILATYLNDHSSYPKSLGDLDNYGTKVTRYFGSEYLYAYYPAVNPKYYHIGISIKVLSECDDVQTRNLESDADFNSTVDGYINGFNGNDPILDFTNRTASKTSSQTNSSQGVKDIPTKIALYMKGGVGLVNENVPVVVSWQYSGKDVQGGFTIERKFESGSYQTIAQKLFDLSYYDKTIEEGKTYTYRVKANYSDTESSPYSNEASITVSEIGTKISNVTINTTTNSAEVSFVTNGDAKGLVEYQYDGLNRLTAQETPIGLKSNHKITVPNLNSGTNYKYRIVISNSQGVYHTTDYSTFTTK